MKCRHPKRLWRLSRDRRFALCGRCDLRVAVLTHTSVYTRRGSRAAEETGE